MYRQYQLDKKRKLFKQKAHDADDEQIRRALNFFDAILDPYLSDEETYSQIKPTNGTPNYSYSHSNVSSLSSSSFQYPNKTHQQFDQNSSPIRRFTSDDNLNQISTNIQKPSHPTRITSTENLSTIPTWKNHLSSFIDKTAGASASLIDLSSIDKLSSQPRFRFVPSSSQNHILKEESEKEQQINSTYDQFHMKTIPSDRTSFSNQTKPSHQIVKPTVIIPSIPKSAPMNRLIETNIYHQNGNSAFKPHRSNKIHMPAKTQQSLPVSNLKRTDFINKPNAYPGLKNSNNTNFSYGQSLMDLSSIGIPQTTQTNVIGSRTSYQPIPSANYIKPPSKLNGHHQYQPPPPPVRVIPEDSIKRWIQQVNNSSSISGLVHPSYYRPLTNGDGNRSQQQAYPSGSYLSPTSGTFNLIFQSYIELLF